MSGGTAMDLLPVAERFARLLTFSDHNTRVVLAGATLLGVAASVVGTFMVLRKRALVGDAISHATLPGIVLAFMVMVAAGHSGKSLPWLLVGAAGSGLLGMALVSVIRSQTRLKEDAALGIVLSVFFGLGMALMGVVQKMKAGHAAGLESFIYGKTASMLTLDAWLIAGCALVVLVLAVLLFKEFGLACFDEAFGLALGWRMKLLDGALLGLMVVVTVIGLQAVGLILVIALLVIPPAAARFWTHRLPAMLAISAGIGGVSCFLGAAASAVLPRLPAGAVIVAMSGAIFLVSMLLGPAKGMLVRLGEQARLQRRVRLQHLLRACYEVLEAAGDTASGMAWETLQRARSWSDRELRRALRLARRAGLVEEAGPAGLRLTPAGLEQARRTVKNHRLWETYLIHYADIAPSHVDRDADLIEHVLGREMVQELESLLEGAGRGAVPPSPHPLRAGPRGGGP